MRTPASTRLWLGMACLLTAPALVAACSTGSSDSAKFASVGNAISDGGGDGGVVAASGGATADQSAPAEAAPVALSAAELDATAAAQDRAVIQTADLVLEVDELEPAVARAKAATEAAGGIVFGEQTSVGDKATSTLTLKVDAAGFTELVEQLRPIGDLAEQSITTDDVTDQLVDVDARITAAEQSLARSTQLMEKANTIVDLAVADAEVTKRQTELERLRAQKASLERQVALSTVILTIRSKAEVAPVVAEEQNQPLPGFGDGLEGGVTALTTIASIGSAVVGALLPFAPFGLMLVGAVIITRRRRRPAPPLTPPSPA